MKAKMVFDTETYGLKPQNIVFDIGYIIFSGKKELVKRNYLVKETFIPEVLKNLPFYGEMKTKKYLAMSIPVMSWNDILVTLWNDLKDNNVEEVIAYNLPFDLNALDATNQLVNKNEFKLFDGIKLTDLYTVFCTFVESRKDYIKYCIQHGFVSKAGNLLTNAQVAYGFLNDNPYHVEDHTALSDVVEELYIYNAIKAKKKKYTMEAKPMPWKIVEYNDNNMKTRNKKKS